ncbi:MAG: methionyl-tRNA formyltransferase [Candidatus Roizmanbacteria bacterium]|nr:methionyl-tRNA formyltransferase [Candidatus Roizmanbacteria bacterium]
MAKIKLAFFGAPDFSAEVLKKIKEELPDVVEIVYVFTQPDRPAGRKQILTSTPVKLFAQKNTIPVFENLNNVDTQLKDVDLVLLYAYGAILPEKILKIPRWGFWNVHPSLLPLYRGTAPIVYSLLLGDIKTGVSLMEMDSRMDHGQIIEQEEYSIQPTDTQETLKKNLSDIGYKLFKKNIQLLVNGALHKKEQDHTKATFTRLLTKEQGFLPYLIVQKMVRGEELTKDELPSIISEYFAKYGTPSSFNLSSAMFNIFRALSPWPGLWTMIPLKEGEKRLKITKVELKGGKPTITQVQLEGKKEVDFETFKKAYLQ